MKSKNPQIGTLAVWAGEKAPFWEGSTQVPVVHSVSFGYSNMDDWLSVGKGQKSGHIYGRNTNPTVQAFEEKICLLEGAEKATSFASGMAAISNTLFTLQAIELFQSKTATAAPISYSSNFCRALR